MVLMALSAVFVIYQHIRDRIYHYQRSPHNFLCQLSLGALYVNLGNFSSLTLSIISKEDSFHFCEVFEWYMGQYYSRVAGSNSTEKSSLQGQNNWKNKILAEYKYQLDKESDETIHWKGLNVRGMAKMHPNSLLTSSSTLILHRIDWCFLVSSFRIYSYINRKKMYHIKNFILTAL